VHTQIRACMQTGTHQLFHSGILNAHAQALHRRVFERQRAAGGIISETGVLLVCTKYQASVCVCVCVPVCVRVGVSCACVCIPVCVHVCVCVFLYACLPVSVCVCRRLCMVMHS